MLDVRDFSDEKLVVSYLKSDEQSLEILIQRYLKLIYNYVYRRVNNRVEAEDITQEVFLKVWRNIKKFDQNKKFKSWIFAIAKNTTIDWLKKKKTIPFSNFSARGGSAFGGEDTLNVFLETLKDTAPLPDEIFEQKNMSLAYVINQLSPQCQKIVSLHSNNDLNFREISNILGESINTVKSRYRRAIIELRQKL